jgi:hypothetical protein
MCHEHCMSMWDMLKSPQVNGERGSAMRAKIQRFPDVCGILEAIEADANGYKRYWGKLAKSLPPEVPDYERKYEANGSRLPIPERRLAFQEQMHRLCGRKRPVFEIIVSEVFAGVDEGFELEGKHSDEILIHRLRFGSNRPCQWTTKVRLKGSDGTERYRSSVPIPYKNLGNVRASLIRTAKTAHRYRHMLVGQSGEFWFVKDKSGYIVEIALYKAGRAEPDATSKLKLLAEIAPWDCPNLEVAIDIIKRYEELLHLSGRRIKSSNMELFRDK